MRMIVDCCAKNVKVIQDKKIPFDLALYGSTLRAAHSCHLQFMVNMNSSASLVLAVVINDNDEDGNSSDDAAVQQPHKSSTSLWGLVVCHHTTPKFVPQGRFKDLRGLKQIYFLRYISTKKKFIEVY